MDGLKSYGVKGPAPKCKSGMADSIHGRCRSPMTCKTSSKSSCSFSILRCSNGVLFTKLMLSLCTLSGVGLNSNNFCQVW